MVSLSNHERLPLRQALAQASRSTESPQATFGDRVSGDGTDLVHANLRN